MGDRLDAWDEQRRAYGREQFKIDMEECSDRVLHDRRVADLTGGTDKQREYALTLQTRALAYILVQARVVKNAGEHNVPHSLEDLKAAYTGLSQITQYRWWLDRAKVLPSRVLNEWISTGTVSKPSDQDEADWRVSQGERAWEKQQNEQAVAEAFRQKCNAAEYNRTRTKTEWAAELADALTFPESSEKQREQKSKWVAHCKARAA